MLIELTVPFQFDDHMDLAARFQINLNDGSASENVSKMQPLQRLCAQKAYPEVLLLGAAIRQVREKYRTVGDEIVGRQRGLVEHGQADHLAVLHLLDEELVPARIQRLHLGRRFGCATEANMCYVWVCVCACVICASIPMKFSSMSISTYGSISFSPSLPNDMLCRLVKSVGRRPVASHTLMRTVPVNIMLAGLAGCASLRLRRLPPETQRRGVAWTVSSDRRRSNPKPKMPGDDGRLACALRVRRVERRAELCVVRSCEFVRDYKVGTVFT